MMPFTHVSAPPDHPLLDLEEARQFLGVSLDTINRRVDDGTFVAVDISVMGESGTRRWLRIYRASLVHMEERKRFAPESVFPHGRDMWKLPEVAELLNCSGKHVVNLMEAAELKGMRIASQNPAFIDRSRRVFRSSLIEFLTAREVRP